MQCALNYSRKVNDAKAKQMRVTWQWLCDEENCAMVVRRVFEGDDRSYGNWKLSSCWIMQSSWSLSEHASIMTLIGSLFGLQARALVQHMICDGRWGAFPRTATGLCCFSLCNTWKLLAKWHERTFFGTIEQYVCDMFLLIGAYVDHSDPGLSNKSNIATE